MEEQLTERETLQFMLRVALDSDDGIARGTAEGTDRSILDIVDRLVDLSVRGE